MKSALLLLSMLAICHAEQPNIVLFVVDDLGQRDLQCYGSTFHETPHLDALARSGAKFNDAYSACPVCSPSRAALFTGQWPQRCGLTDYIGAPMQPKEWNRNTVLLPATYVDRLLLENETIATALRERGYATFFAGKWHLGPEEFWPEHHGFDHNKGGVDKGGPYGGKMYFSPYENPRLTNGPDGEHLTDRLAMETIHFIENNKDRPFFACYSFYDVHTPLMAREDLKKKYEKKHKRLGLIDRWGREGERDVRLTQDHVIYAAMVEAMDLAVGKVLAKLEALNLTKNTIVIFTSDNGGLSTSEGWPTSNLPLRGGKGWMYDGGIRVPLLIRWPGVTKVGASIDTPVISMDFFPTLIQATGKTQTTLPHADGVNLLPLLKGEKLPERSLYWHYPHYGNQGGAPAAAVRKGAWKLIHWFEDDRKELFDVRNDIGETKDLGAEHPERVAAMFQDLSAWQKSVDAKFPTPNPRYNPQKPNGRAAKRSR
jgi:arylsulfatase A-like enzyme